MSIKTAEIWAKALLIHVNCLLILSACNLSATDSGLSTTVKLGNSQWVLHNTKNSPNRPITLSFASNRLSGFNGCNSYNGNYASNRDGALVLGHISVSRMSCGGKLGDFEQNYMQQLLKVQRYSLNHGRLQLLDAQHQPLLTFFPI